MSTRTSNGYSSELGHKLLVASEYADVILLAGESKEKIFAHKCILSAASRHFKSLFTNESKESKDRHITLENIPYDLLDILVRFIYTGELCIDDDNVNVLELVVHANYLALKEAGVLGWEHIVDNLDVNDAVQAYVLAGKMERPKEMREAMAILLEHFVDLVRTEDFLNIDVSLLCHIVGDNKLQTNSETEVFHAIRLWINHNPGKRESDFPRLLAHVRLPLLTPEFMFEYVDPVCRCIKTKDYLKEGLYWHTLEDKSRLVSQNDNEREPE